MENITNSKLLINCSICKSEWMVGDRERTEEEKNKWVCPNCKEEMAQIAFHEAQEDEANDFSLDYPLGGMVEPYDIDREDNLCQ